MADKKKNVKVNKAVKLVTMYHGKHVIEIKQDLVQCHKDCGWTLKKDK